MQQHPVPQNITAFEFKLIGFLTIKQFAYLAAASIFSFVFFISPIPGILKFIIITPFALLGIALAFVPINGLPFDKWIVVFIRSVYSPSRRVWRKSPKEISFLSPAFSNYLKRPPSQQRIARRDSSRLRAYIASLRKEGKASHLDTFEEERLSKLDFGATVPHFGSAQEINTDTQTEVSSGRPISSDVIHDETLVEEGEPIEQNG